MIIFCVQHAGTKERKESRPRISFYTKILSSLRLLQFSGYFTSPIGKELTGNSASQRKASVLSKVVIQRQSTTWLLRLFFVSILTVNCVFLVMMMSLINEFHQRLGMWHAFTVAGTINGLRPLINVLNGFCYNVRMKQHKKMLRYSPAQK